MPSSPDDSLILIVEDSTIAVEQLERRLSKDFPFSILTAKSYAEAREQMERHAREIFVAVLDLNLPDASGGDVVELAEAYGVPRIVFTSLVSNDVRQSLMSQGVIDYVVKDRLALDELAFTIRRLHENRGTKVLVVDDSRSVRAYIRSLLENYMLEVFEAESGEQALEILDAEEEILLVVTDYEMHAMNGAELTSAIRSRYSRDDMAVMGVSSRSDKPLSVHFLKQGADDFLIKPFENEEFLCRVLRNIETVRHDRRLKELAELKNRFLGMVVHDLRNPLNAIKGFAELMLKDKSGSMSSDHTDMVGFVHKAATQMNDLVSDLLDISVIESGSLELAMETCRIDEVVLERMHLLRIPARSKGIEVAFEGDVAVARVDRDRFAQVVDNLLSNALKYSPKGTAVNVTLQKGEERFQLTVSDQGQGIPEEEQTMLFQSFQRLSTKPTAGETSTGLGLAIVQKIVEGHGGEVRVFSAPGQGAAFTVDIPLAPPVPPALSDQLF